MNLSWLKKSSDWNFHLFEKSFGWLSFSWIIEWNFCRFLSLPLELNISSSSWHFRAFVQGNKSFKIKLLDQKIVCIYRLVFINTPIASGKALCNIFKSHLHTKEAATMNRHNSASIFLHLVQISLEFVDKVLFEFLQDYFLLWNKNFPLKSSL